MFIFSQRRRGAEFGRVIFFLAKGDFISRKGTEVHALRRKVWTGVFLSRKDAKARSLEDTKFLAEAQSRGVWTGAFFLQRHRGARAEARSLDGYFFLAETLRCTHKVWAVLFTGYLRLL